MLQIYHAPRTRGFRVIWLCEELSLSYSIVRVDMAPAYRSSPEWRRMNPVGKVPVMRDGDLAMFESGAMVQYLLDRYAKGRLQPPAGTPEHGLYLQWSWFAEATFARPLGEIVNHRREFAGAEVPAAIAEMQARALSCARAVDHGRPGQVLLAGRRILGRRYHDGLYLAYLSPADARPAARAHGPLLEHAHRATGLSGGGCRRPAYRCLNRRLIAD